MARGRGNKDKKTKGKGKGSVGFNRKNSEDFLDKNRRKDGVITTSSGLQYTVIEDGAGNSPTPKQTVIVQQRIMLIDGTIIDDTYKTPDPAEFDMKDAIEGYREGLQLMKEGAKFQFYIPSDLAYGDVGNAKIGPAETLIFDVELLEIVE